jgi:acetylglutamate kinase
MPIPLLRHWRWRYQSCMKLHLVYCFEKKGVLQDINDEDSLIREINPERYEKLKTEQIIHSGMLPKMDNAFTAISCGVKAVIIGHSDDLGQLKNKQGFGTRLSK